jgi:hypothetical protein
LRRNCLLKQVTAGKIEGRIEVTRRRGRRRKELVDNLRKRGETEKLKDEAPRSHSVENSLWKRLVTS